MDDESLRDAFTHGGDSRPDAEFADALEARLRVAAAAPAPVVEMADADEPAPAGARGRRLRWRAVVALGAAAAVVAGLVVIRGGSHTSSRFTLGEVAKATVGTARFETTMQETMSGGTTGTSTWKMTGELDLAHHAARATLHETSKLAIGVDGQIGGGSTIERLLVGGVRYDGIDFWLRLRGGTVPSALQGKKWVRVEPASSVESSGTSSTTAARTASATTAPSAPGATSATTAPSATTAIASDATTAPAATSSPAAPADPELLFLGDAEAADPAAIVAQLDAAGARLTPLGTATVRGTFVRRYRVVLHDPRRFPAAASISIAVDARGRLRQSLAKYRMPASAREVPGSRSTVRIESDFFDFGLPVRITAPPASEVVTMEELDRLLDTSGAPRVGSSSGSSSATTTPIVVGPTTLSTPWRMVASGDTGASWRAFAGRAPGWTCYSIALTNTVAGATITAITAGGTRTVVEGKDAACLAAGAPPAALLGEATGPQSLVVGVAPANGHVLIQLSSGTTDLSVRNGVFAWVGRASDVPQKVTITDAAGAAALTCTLLPGAESLTCDSTAQSFVVGQPSP